MYTYKPAINPLKTLFTLFIILFSQSVFAHFHYELSVSSSFQANKNNQLESIKVTWIYDDEVSGLMLKDQKDVKKLGDTLMKDLDKLAYFTFLKLNGKIIDTKKVESYKLEEIKHQDYSNLKLTFTLPLEAPVKLEEKAIIDINHEDATSSAIIYYENPSAFVFDKNLKSQCKAIITEKPDFKEGESPQTVKVLCNS